MTTVERIEEMLVEEIAKAVDAGLVLNHIYPNIELTKSTRDFASCHRDMVGREIFCTIRVSKYFLEATEMQIRTTLMHEVLHAVCGSRGHDVIWKLAAARINRLYGAEGYEIKRLGSQLKGVTQFSLAAQKEAEEGENVHKYVFKCQKCGLEIRRIRRSRFTENPNKYHCTCCGGKFERVR